MSLVPKLVEVHEFILRNRVDIGFITETWLRDTICDSVVDIPGYKVFRKDRKILQHGGVCIYLKDGISYKILEDLRCCDEHEIIWLKLRPTRLPRGFTCLVVAVVYHPPGSDPHTMLNHLFNSLSNVESTFLNCGLIVVGDFNRLDVSSLKRHFKLKQTVKSATRGQAILDLILTNMADHFSVPEIHPPFGLSDHNTVLMKAKERVASQSTRKCITVRDMRESRKKSLGLYISNINWSTISAHNDVESMLSTFEEIVKVGMDKITPEKTIRIYPKDPPWMSTKLKELIMLRQAAFHTDKNGQHFKSLRNAVNRERKTCKGKFYGSKVHDLKGKDSRKWWKEVKKLSRSDKNSSSNLIDQLAVPDFLDLTHKEIANVINLGFLEPLESFQPLDPSTARVSVEEDSEILTVTPMRVHNALRKLDKHKASGPDGLPNWLLREFADVLVEPITNIMNASFREQELPTSWKQAYISPIPKTKQVINPKKDLRPISLTPTISKVAEDFIVSDYIKPAVMKIIDPNQFGTISNSSTTMAIISMLHKWYGDTDGTGSTIRVLLCDYRKAFDLIDHSLLVAKLKQLDIPGSVINWIISFLTGRSQRVALGNHCFSEWGRVPSGVPQGTKLGPWLFLIMINDLIVSEPFSIWKYVDDSTVSETVLKGAQSNIQLAADEVNLWSKSNLFQLNCEKTKELVITYGRSKPEDLFPPISIEEEPIGVVTKTYLLGVTINSKLSWDDHITKLVKKATRKIYFLVQLKRARVPPTELVLYYCACIRSSLDYACPAFHHALPKYLRDELERVQKRALACIFPAIHYHDALSRAKIKSIDEHHEELTNRLFDKILRNPTCKLNQLIPDGVGHIEYDLRCQRTLHVPITKTQRFLNSFIISSSNIYNALV